MRCSSCLGTWHVRKTRLKEQADRVLALEPDVVCLQEVTPVTAETWLERLAAAGLGGALAPLPKAQGQSPCSRPHAAMSTSGRWPTCVWTFARDRYGRLMPERGERWDSAESALIRGLEPSGFRDAFRELNGFESKEPSGNGRAGEAATASTT